MSLTELLGLIRWDIRMNLSPSFDQLRAICLLIEVRGEQYVYQKAQTHPNLLMKLIWNLCRFLGSIYQWLFFNSTIPGSVSIGRGLRLPHPQNLVITRFADIGEFCIIYHNVSLVWNGFKRPANPCLKVGNRVLIGNGAILIGHITIGDEVLIGAGAVVPKSVPTHSLVVNQPAKITPRAPSANAPKAGSKAHRKDFFSIWR